MFKETANNEPPQPREEHTNSQFADYAELALVYVEAFRPTSSVVFSQRHVKKTNE